MKFHTRKWIKPEDLNPNGTLFGGSLLKWIDEEAAIYAIIQLDSQRVVAGSVSVSFASRVAATNGARLGAGRRQW
jgi:acyl-CoA hydrolase